MPDDYPDSPAESDNNISSDEEWESPFRKKPPPERETVSYRGATNDPVFGYLIALALSIGLIPLIPANSDLRYAILWLVMAGFGVLAWLMGSSARISTETPENLGWGVIFGLLIAVPFLIIGSSILQQTSQRLFPEMKLGEVLAFLVFVIPLAETLFFRGVLQETRPFWQVGLFSSIWSVLVFFPLLDVGKFPAVAIMIGTALVMMNVMYTYVRSRNGLAAAWLCQIVVNVILLFIPLL
jgi:CAAX prenyl protease-like protein